MKKLTLALATIAFASVANAGIKLDVRSDYQNKQKGKAWSGAAGSAVAAETESSQNYLNAVELVLDSKIADNVTASAKLLGNTGTVGAIDYAYVTHTFMEGFSLDFGKVSSMAGGFENYDGINDFSNSLAKNNSWGVTGVTGVPPSYVGNGNGMGLNYTMGTNKLGLQFINAESNTNKRHAMGLWYHGTFDMVQVLASYYSGEQGTAAPYVNSTDMAVGVRGNFSGVGVTFDYLTSTDLKASNDKDNSINTMLLDVNYAMGMYTPFFGYETSEVKVAGEKAVTRTSMNLGAKIKVADSFGYHVAYSTTTDKDSVGLATGGAKLDNTADNRIIAGVSFSADLLK